MNAMTEFTLLVWKYWAFAAFMCLFLIVDGYIRGTYTLVFVGAVLALMNIIDVFKWPALKRKLFADNSPAS